jgi:hypothetical protein
MKVKTLQGKFVKLWKQWHKQQDSHNRIKNDVNYTTIMVTKGKLSNEKNILN